jgi:hypothetical protein
MKLKNHYKSEFNSSFYLLSNFEIKMIMFSYLKKIRPYPSPFLVSSPVAFKFLNVLVLNIAEKLLAGH